MYVFKVSSTNTGRKYGAVQIYAEHRLPLWTAPPESNETKLGAGAHEWPFEFALPANSPANFTHENGKISYILKCKIDRVRRTDLRRERALTVVRRLDARALASVLPPPSAFIEQTLGAPLRRHGGLKLTVRSGDKKTDVKSHIVFWLLLGECCARRLHDR